MPTICYMALAEYFLKYLRVDESSYALSKCKGLNNYEEVLGRLGSHGIRD